MPTKTPDFSLFNQEVSPALLAQAIHIYQENSHQGVAKTKTRGEVDLTKHKAYKQRHWWRPSWGQILPFTLVEVSFLVQLQNFLSLNQKMKVKALLGILSLYQKKVVLLN